MSLNIINPLKKLYNSIPSFECLNCHKCCGPIIWFEPEEILINNYLRKKKIKKVVWTKEEFEKNKMICPYVVNDKCIIYSARPIVCRLQGNIADLKCNLLKNCKLMSKQELNYIREEFIKLIKQTNGINNLYSTLKPK